MSWTAPRTWVNGEVETAALFNTHIRDNFSLLSTVFDTATGLIDDATSASVLSRATTLRLEDMNTTSAPNSGTGETDLISFSLPAATLAASADFVRITSWGTTTSSANAKTIRQYFGTSLGAMPILINTANNWNYVSHVYRSGAATQLAVGVFTSGTSNALDNAISIATASPTQTLSGAVTVKTTGQGGASSEITALGQMVEVFPV